MKRVAVSFALIFTIFPLLASDWVRVGNANQGKSTYEYKQDSIDIEEVGSTTFATAVFRVLHPNENTKFYKFKVTHAACRTGYGSLHAHSLANTELWKADYADGGGNVGSGVAEYICAKASNRAMNMVIRNKISEIDYVNDSDASKEFDKIFADVRLDPAHKNQSIDWIANETHRLLMAKRKKSGV